MTPAKKLLHFNFDADTFVRRALETAEVSIEQFTLLKKIAKEHNGQESGRPDAESLGQIHRIFTTTPPRRLSTEFASSRRIRQLAWALTYTEDKLPRIVDTQQLCTALSLIKKRFRTSVFLGTFYALLEAWDSPNVGTLQAFIKEHLMDYDGSQKFIQKLKGNMGWYCEKNSAAQLATHLLLLQKKLSDVWTYLGLPEYMRGYPYFGAVATEYTAYNNQLNTEHVADVIAFVRKHNNDKTSRTILSKLIKKLGTDASESLRQSVQSYALQKWQDPRIAGADVRWRDISDKARQIFTKWITEEDLRFFFDVVAKACNDQKFAYRKAFWLAYFEHITFCRPVLRKNAEHLFRYDSQALQYYQDRHPAELKGGNSNQHAFIIQMGDYTFIEFSTAGACYVYHNAGLPFELGDSEYHMDELRSQLAAEHRVIHNSSERYSWQRKFASWLEYEIDIEPLRSYRLDGTPNSHIIDHSDTSQKKETEFHIINCPNWSCQQRLRVPMMDKPIRVKCSRCNTHFEC